LAPRFSDYDPDDGNYEDEKRMTVTTIVIIIVM
jgi:hypothetical protein